MTEQVANKVEEVKVQNPFAQPNGGNEAECFEWSEVRVEGKLPERRANHASFIADINGEDYLYIHGGRDLKEGAMSSLWRVNLTKVHAMDEDPYLTVEWEPVKTVGGDIGKISHHSAVVCAPNKVIFYGGLVGEDSNDKVYLFDLVKHSWSQIPLKCDSEIPPRDDHGMCLLPTGDGFITFGGFVNGIRVNDVIIFKFDGSALCGEVLTNPDISPAPKVRNGMSIGLDGDKMFVFGGQDDDSNKLSDMWEFSMSARTWT